MTFPQPFDENSASEVGADVPADFGDDVLYEEQVRPEYGILGFTLRELIIVGLWLVAFIVSFIPAGSASPWSLGISWILPIGLPTVAVFLIVLRRFSPEGIRRVGSLGIDQFASVAFSVAAISWAQTLWQYIAAMVETGVSLPVWAPVVQLAMMLGLVAASVFAFLIPGLREDFQGRLETLAHRNANPVRPVIPRPRTPQPASITPDATATAFPAAPSPAPAELDVELSGRQGTDEIARLDLSEQIPLSAHASGGDIGAAPPATEDEYVPGYARRSRRSAEDDGDADELDPAVAPISALGFDDLEIMDDRRDAEQVVPERVAEEPVVVAPADLEDVSTRAVDIDATNPRTAPAASQPFWALAPTERDVVDERGEAIFRIGPNAWALVIEDRGGAFVVRHDDGRIGYLHDIADITKG